MENTKTTLDPLTEQAKASPKTIVENPSFCSMAWNHQFLDPTGRVKPCCRFEEKHRPPESHLSQSHLKDIFYGEWMNSIRAKMKSGLKVSGCTRCYQEEAAGKRSLRQRYNQNSSFPLEELVDLEHPKIRWLELAISNNCNLACRMCDSRYSLKWFEEEKEIFGSTYSPKKLMKFDIQEIYPFLSDLIHIKITGGEPLVTPDHWVLIKKLVSENYAKNIFINYSTNCTIHLKPEWERLWNQFKNVEFALSFDSALKSEAEYIRWPANYETIESVTRSFLEMENRGQGQFQTILRTTVSILNVWGLPKTLEWWYDNYRGPLCIVNPTHLTFPDFLSVQVLPPFLKQKVSEQFDRYMEKPLPEKFKNSLIYIKNYMNGSDQSHKLKELQTYLKKTDKYRRQDFFESYPYFSEIFKSL